MKPGVKTSEFWVSLAGLLGGLAALFGVIPQETVGDLQGAIGQVAGGVIAGLSALGYAMSRGKVKAGEKEK